MKINYTLPEFCFLDGNSHKGDSLENRTVIQHIRSYTILEAVALDEIDFFDFGKRKTYKFDYINRFGIVEKHIFVLHFSMTSEDDYILIDIFKKCEEWYKKYLDWEDEGIRNTSIAKLN
jgi:hypothetical protein